MDFIVVPGAELHLRCEVDSPELPALLRINLEDAPEPEVAEVAA